MPFVSLAFGAMPVSARVVTDMHVPAMGIGTPVDMSAQSSGSAISDGIKRSSLP